MEDANEDRFKLIDLYFENSQNIWVKHHVDSFNQFIEEMIPNIIQKDENILMEQNDGTTITRHRITFTDIGIKPPTYDNEDVLIYPLEAMEKKITYSAKYVAKVFQWTDKIDIATGQKTTELIAQSEDEVCIAKMPIMVGSKYCNLVMNPDLQSKHCKYDGGGYFIIRGSEKVVISLESMIQRKPIVMVKKEQGKDIFSVKVQSRNSKNFVGNFQTFIIKIKKDNTIVATTPRFGEVNVFVMMKALGLETDDDILASIVRKDTEKELLNELHFSLYTGNLTKNGFEPITKQSALETLLNS